MRHTFRKADQMEHIISVFCNVDLNGDRRLNVADVLTLLDVSEECETCLLQIAKEFNNLRRKR